VNVLLGFLLSVVLASGIYTIGELGNRNSTWSTPTVVSYVDETNQPNCVVGAYCMYASEMLNINLTPKTLEHDIPMMKQPAISISSIPVVWNTVLFPSNQIRYVYNVIDTNTYNFEPREGRPYIWTGQWYANTNNEYHTCLVYFHRDYVIFKHFVYNPKTMTNYMVRTNLEFFLSRTISVYSLK